MRAPALCAAGGHGTSAYHHDILRARMELAQILQTTSPDRISIGTSRSASEIFDVNAGHISSLELAYFGRGKAHHAANPRQA